MLLQKISRLGVLAGAVFLAGCVAEGGPDYRPPMRPGPSQPQMCPMIYAPVCGERRGERKTLSSSCVARAEGYRVVSNGRCTSSRPGGGWGGEGTRPTRPPQQSHRPGRPGGSSGACTREYRPVCAQRGGDRQTFSNSCTAEKAGYRIIRSGQCR
ncbi:protease inhibitor [Falsochrobactrum sp. TDYN1]|uniref:Protease inhibitor n=1 Tax=Falsochrobactrum tianjinense TaxID=2706015 RepID=A0A949UUP0_9HYPH|nr:Kazal-type serine protease inhibitor domain-containing protein [Falsochrobactrum sp. TDYN1]MBV2143997.1 protease inhibitor [Falsochrobactrum sp. TDYN1]